MSFGEFIKEKKAAFHARQEEVRAQKMETLKADVERLRKEKTENDAISKLKEERDNLRGQTGIRAKLAAAKERVKVAEQNLSGIGPSNPGGNWGGDSSSKGSFSAGPERSPGGIFAGDKHAQQGKEVKYSGLDEPGRSNIFASGYTQEVKKKKKKESGPRGPFGEGYNQWGR